MMTTRSRTTAAAVLLTSIVLAGCTGEQSPQEATTAATDALPTPIEVLAPDSREDCTTTLRTASSPTPNPNIVRIDCGEKSAEVEGTFRDGYTNIYDPNTAFDVEQIIVVGGEVRAWLRFGNSTCLVLHTPGEAPVECKPTESPEAPALEPVPAPTFSS